MKISWIKYEKDEASFKMPESLGFDVFKLSDLEKVDETLKKLIDNKYHTIIVSNDIAAFSEDLIKKYSRWWDDKYNYIKKENLSNKSKI